MIAIRPVYTSYEREEYMKPFGIVPEENTSRIRAALRTAVQQGLKRFTDIFI